MGMNDPGWGRRLATKKAKKQLRRRAFARSCRAWSPSGSPPLV